MLSGVSLHNYHWSPRNCCLPPFKPVTRMLGLTKRSRQLNFLCFESHHCCLSGWRTSCKSVLESSGYRQRSQHRSGFSRESPTRSESSGFTYRWNCLCHLPSAFWLWHCNIGSASWASIAIPPLEAACTVLSLENCGSLRWRSYRCYNWDWYATYAISLSASHWSCRIFQEKPCRIWRRSDASPLSWQVLLMC